MTNNTSDFSSEDVRKAQALAPQLDPDIARAITEGNGPVIQAIANGAATDTQIAERLISMGLTTGLPPGVQQMVNEQMRQAADKREAESRNSEKQTAGMAGLALPGDSGEARAETGGSGRAWTQNIAEMDFGQKMSYLSDIEDMSFEKFAAKSDAERRKDLENIKKDAEARLSTAQGELTQHHEKMKSDPRLGATPEERQRAMARIDAATDIDRFSGERSEAEISDLPTELRAFAREEWRIKRALYYNQNAITQADRAKEALDRGDLHGAWILTADAAAEKTADMRKNLGKATKGLEEEYKHQQGTTLSAAALKHEEDSTRTMKKAASLASTADEQAKLRETRAENVAVRESIYLKKTVLAANKPQADDDFAEPAPRLTINGAPLAAAGIEKLGAPEVVANNEIDPALKPEALKVAQTAPAATNNG